MSERRTSPHLTPMNRRRYFATGMAILVPSVAGCTDAIDDLLEDDAVAQGDVYRDRKGLTFEAAAGDVIHITPNVRDEGSRRGEMTLYGPNGDEVDSTRFAMDGTGPSRETFDAESDGEHRIEINPRGDDQARLRVSVSVEEN